MISKIVSSLANLLYELTYYIGIFFCKILNVLYGVFRILAGTQTVTYHDQERYLIDIFFSDTTVTTVYAGMALIGIILLFVFTILAVVKKMADLDDKMQASLGSILRKMLTSFLFIISMNFIMIATINITNQLMQSIEYLFDHANELQNVTYITFNDQEYATMARIFNTIGNFSVNESSTSRYNLNSCYNEIRPDMQVLQKQNVFKFSYDVTVGDSEQESWQSILAQIARAHDLSEEQAVDEYDAALSSAMMNAMNYVRVNKNSMYVHQSYQADSATAVSTDQGIDVILWLCATTDAAKNKAYNGNNVSYGDPVRNPYMTGERSIYKLSQVEEDFSISWGDFDHLVVIIGGFMMCAEFLGLAINCVARIFNMILLYIVAPPFIATAPFDDGAKFKQWSTAFVIQSFNVFGSIISIRLMLLIIPIVFDSKLVLTESSFINMLAKALIIIGAAYTARKANSLISGILAENAGYQSLFAGDAASAVRQGGFGRLYDTAAGTLTGMGKSAVGKMIGGAGDVGGWAAKTVAKSPYSLSKWSYNTVRGKVNRGDLNRSMAEDGDAGKRAARDFLDMDKTTAMKKYNADEDKYAEMRSHAHNVLEGRSGGNGEAVGTSGQQNNPLTNLNANTMNQNSQNQGSSQNNNQSNGQISKQSNSQSSNQNNNTQKNGNIQNNQKSGSTGRNSGGDKQGRWVSKDAETHNMIGGVNTSNAGDLSINNRGFAGLNADSTVQKADNGGSAGGKSAKVPPVNFGNGGGAYAGGSNNINNLNKNDNNNNNNINNLNKNDNNSNNNNMNNADGNIHNLNNNDKKPKVNNTNKNNINDNTNNNNNNNNGDDAKIRNLNNNKNV